ncbi:MAG: type I-E CRISPR-associated protein Cas6/Cse3/CasE [Desulfobacterales bacterium]|nr:type I-E CRISPR-associated protein Cas6/Cse3/CasE [Desulfobacterales bacterium]
MNCLARFVVDAETIRDERIWDNYAWHQRIWQDCFPNEPDAQRDFLTRVDPIEGAYRVWILSQRPPIRPGWCPQSQFELKEIAPSFLAYRYYAFDLKANPVKTQVQRGPNGEALLRPDGKRKSGKRVPLIKQDELRAWLVHKAQARCKDKDTGQDVPGGFRILDDRPLEISPMQAIHFRKNNHTAYHGGVQFRGTLEVTDRVRFMETFQTGIGSAKSFGFGLLLLAPIK